MDNQNVESSAFSFRVPFNNEIYLNSRKKAGKKTGIIMIFATAFFLILTIAGALSNAGIGVVLLFVAFTLFCMGTMICLFMQGRYNSKNDNLAYLFVFLPDGLQISKNSKKNVEQFRVETACLYRPFNNKQYVHKVVETVDSFTFSVYTGTYNFVPQYKEHCLPKDVFQSNEQLNNFTNALKTIFTTDYVCKITTI